RDADLDEAAHDAQAREVHAVAHVGERLRAQVRDGVGGADGDGEGGARTGEALRLEVPGHVVPDEVGDAAVLLHGPATGLVLDVAGDEARHVGVGVGPQELHARSVDGAGQVHAARGAVGRAAVDGGDARVAGAEDAAVGGHGDAVGRARHVHGA